MTKAEKWLIAKEMERAAQELRRAIEDEMGPDYTEYGYKITVTERMNRKIDADLLQEIAAENGLTDHLSALFRWKPEINAKDWKAAAPEITAVLEEAITSTPGRASFKIEKIEE